MSDTAFVSKAAAVDTAAPASSLGTLTLGGGPRRLALVTDAWFPQINGVVRTLDTMRRLLSESGVEVLTITPDKFRNFPCPTYPEIRLAVLPGRRLAQMLGDFQPEAIHIATEGPLGLAARAYCRRHGKPFTTSFHTKFPEYVEARIALPARWSYAWLRRFHRSAVRTMVATPSLEAELHEKGFEHLVRWTRGVDISLFHPRDKALFAHLPRPVCLYVGRVAVEKNIGAFLDADLPGSKVVVGDGPQLAELRRKYPAVTFAGARVGEDLAQHYAAADVFVFPSLTDTFGLVLLEALASGVPVAAYPVTGPLDVIGSAPVGALDHDLAAATRRALGADPAACRAFAEAHSWLASATQYYGNLQKF